MALFSRITETHDGQTSESTGSGWVGGTIFWRPSSNDQMVYKYAFDNIKNGAVVVVHHTQRAYLFLNGVLAHAIPPSGEPYKLLISNIPILDRFLNVATGGTTHRTAEIWFVNVETERPVLWGLGDLPILDHSMGAEFIIGARGGYNIKIEDGELLLMKLVGTLHSFTTDDMLKYFRQKISSLVSQAISNIVDMDQLSIVSLQRNKSSVESKVEISINSSLESYGIKINNFAIENYNLPEEYRTVLKEQTKGLAERKRLDKLGVNYSQERQFDIMDNVAKNEGGTAGNMMNLGMGLTMGAGVGQTMGQTMQNTFNQAGATTPPPIPTVATYYLAINGQQVGPVGLDYILGGINSGSITPTTLYWQQGMTEWCEISTSNALMSNLQFLPPPIPTL